MKKSTAENKNIVDIEFDGERAEGEKFDGDKTSVVPSDTFKVRLAQAGAAPPSVVMLVGPAANVGRQWSIEDTDRILGRSVSAHIFVDDRSVSKSHAKFVLSHGDVSVIDLESTNKTIVNGQIITPLTPVKLRNNDQIKTGNVIFKFLERGNIESVSAAQTFDRGLIDALTGINNKGSLIDHAPGAFKKAELLGVPLSVIAFDIDHFKKVNDTYGHPAGDYVLKEIARVVKTRLIRENDFFARSGGEEFVLMLLGSNINQASEVASRIRMTIQNHSFVFEGKTIPVTISSGVASKTPMDKDFEAIFERSDKALYQSKGAGRNRVTVMN